MPTCRPASRENEPTPWPRYVIRTGKVLALGLAFILVPAAAAPRLSCEIFQGGDTLQLQFEPVSDPYSVKPVNLNNRFRFKAVVIGSAAKIDYIKLYTYYVSSGRAVLLHYAKYLSPVTTENAAPGALTGQQYFYSPVLGREMHYACALVERSV